jgi:endonuclease/exonuclease/phosphatase family metal-dependent hydrolase
MKLATFNVENMFDRAKALNGATWATGRAALEAHAALNALFNKKTYSAADKTKMLKLLGEQGLLKTDEGPFLMLRKIRGKLLDRPRSGAVTVTAGGRDEWTGWAELKSEPVKEAATQNTARVIGAVNADVLGVVEAEDRTTLRLFNERVIPSVDAEAYEHVMLIDGNDERGIDVGILTKAAYPILSIRSFVDAHDAKGRIFSRDCAEYQIGLPAGGSLWVLVNHLKSKGYGKASDNDAKRLRQAQKIRQIYDEHIEQGHELVAVIGDFNDAPGNAPLKPLLGNGSTLRDISAHPRFDNGGFAGTHGNCAASAKLDYILLSPKLFAEVRSGSVERRGMWGGTNGDRWERFDEVKSTRDAASDHAALLAELGI